MSHNTTAARIMAAQARVCEQLAKSREAARADGATASELADLEAQEQAAHRRYQELAVDMGMAGRGPGGEGSANVRRPWWRFW